MIDKRDFIKRYEECIGRRSVRLSKDVIERVGEYFYLLYCANEKTNLTGYSDIEDYVDFHLLDALHLVSTVNPKDDCSLIDVGSGAGVPGLLMKLLRMDLNVTLIESNKKKTDFLHDACRELSLNNLRILTLRAEEAARDVRYREKADVAVARALGPFSVALELTIGFVKAGGFVVLPRSGEESVKEEIERCSGYLSCQFEKQVEYSLPRREKSFQTVFIQKNKNLSLKYPRKPGQIRKRPL